MEKTLRHEGSAWLWLGWDGRQLGQSFHSSIDRNSSFSGPVLRLPAGEVALQSVLSPVGRQAGEKAVVLAERCARGVAESTR